MITVNFTELHLWTAAVLSKGDLFFQWTAALCLVLLPATTTGIRPASLLGLGYSASQGRSCFGFEDFKGSSWFGWAKGSTCYWKTELGETDPFLPVSQISVHRQEWILRDFKQQLSDLQLHCNFRAVEYSYNKRQSWFICLNLYSMCMKSCATTSKSWWAEITAPVGPSEAGAVCPLSLRSVDTQQ